MTKEEKSLHTLVDSVQYDVNLFKVYIGENKYIMGYMSATPEDNNFFVYKTIYNYRFRRKNQEVVRPCNRMGVSV